MTFPQVLIIEFYCLFCCEMHLHAFRRDEGVFEVYECLQCHQLNKVAVR